MTAATSEASSKRRLPAWAARTISGVVCLGIAGALAGLVWSQRVSSPVDGQALNVVQGVGAFEDLPHGWRAVHTSGTDYLAIRENTPLTPLAVGSVAQTVQKLERKAAREGVQFDPGDFFGAVQDAANTPMGMLYYGTVGKSSMPGWYVFDDISGGGGYSQFGSEKAADADLAMLSRLHQTVIDTTKG